MKPDSRIINIPSLNKDAWQKVNVSLAVKIIAEMMHEDVLHPAITNEQEDGSISFRLDTDKQDHYYTFSGYRRILSYIDIDPHSLSKYNNANDALPVDAMELLLELQQQLKADSFTMAHYIEEVLHTLCADAYMLHLGKPDAAAIADADFHKIEQYMEGHPWYIINKGRIGFSYKEYEQFAPEALQQIQLIWIAVHKSRAYYEFTGDNDFDRLMKQELSDQLFDKFIGQLQHLGVNPKDYWLMPINEWQWNHKIIYLFAGDIAAQYLIPLGISDDSYSPQQSIRTYYNLDHPDKYFVKTTMSILNTSYIRGLSPSQLKIAPRLTHWLQTMVKNDEYLQEKGLFLLGEVATIGYFHPYFEAIVDPPYYYNEFLSVLWRESPHRYLQPGERMATMASLLYIDEQGKSAVGELIERSGLSAEEWVIHYLEAYLCPVLHIYYKHSICVNPHGENTILVLKDHIPVRIALKDFIGDVLLNDEAQQKLPKEFTENLIHASNPENVPLVVLIGIFDSFFRYLSNILHTRAGFEENNFWRCVYKTVIRYQKANPDLQDKFIKYDIFVPTFKRLNLNSQRFLKGYKETTGFEKAEKKGALENPIYQFVALKETADA